MAGIVPLSTSLVLALLSALLDGGDGGASGGGGVRGELSLLQSLLGGDTFSRFSARFWALALSAPKSRCPTRARAEARTKHLQHVIPCGPFVA